MDRDVYKRHEQELGDLFMALSIVYAYPEGKVNYLIQFQNLNGIKGHTTLICIYSCPDYTFLDPRELCGTLDDTLPHEKCRKPFNLKDSEWRTLKHA
jgi:hypothetical protein